ncbi:gas vesicle protein [Candidatus Gracilibacteria bacterium]|nr:gas vesicle protein [Candidatus Gracilibacteria bacterium]
MFWLAETLTEHAENEIYNPELIRARMEELEMRFELGEMSEEAFYEAEDILLARLREARLRLAERGE